MQIRLATESDAAACLRIYKPVVENTAISFEETAPSVEEMTLRIRKTLTMWPWLVCYDPNLQPDQSIVGYAYAGTHRTRAAYRWTVESAIYIDENHRGKGIGNRLYRGLFGILRKQWYRTVVAGATIPNPASVKLHEQLGFKTIGVFNNIGFKFNQWHSTQWFELDLETNHAPHEPRPLPELLANDGLAEILRQT